MKIKLFNKIADIGTNQFDPSAYEFFKSFDTYSAIVVRNAKLHDMGFPAGLRYIVRVGAEVSNIPPDRCSEQGTTAFNTPRANASAVKELVMAGLLIPSRRIAKGIGWIKTLEGDDIFKAVEKGKSNFISPEVADKELGAIGFDTVGVLVANATVTTDMEVFGYDPSVSVKTAWTLKARVCHVQSPKQILKEYDYMTVYVPFNDKTANIIDTEAIAAMKSDMRVLSFVCSGLIDDEAMMKAMDEEKIIAHVTDFLTKELLQYEQVTGALHFGASTPESEENYAVMAANGTIEYPETGNIIHSVNLPDIQLAQECKCRICVINKDVPNVVGTITTTFANIGVNIENMASKGKKDYAYMILSTDDKVSEELMERLRSREDIINARLITAKA